MLLHYQPETYLLAPAIHGCYIQEVRGQSGPVVSAEREEEEEEDREGQGGGMCVWWGQCVSAWACSGYSSRHGSLPKV